MGGYVRVTAAGYGQNEHVLVAEKKLGRKIGKSEVVHHIDENKENNDPGNLMVLRSKGDHTRIHAKIPIEVFQTSDGSHVVITKQRECPRCQRPFVPTNNRDVHCSLACYATSKASNIPTKEVLEALVKNKPATHVAKEFGVSDVTIAKWCVKLGIERTDGRKIKKIQV